MQTQLRRMICIFIIPLILSGCASVVLVDRSNALVMPDHVARKILAKHFGEEWAKSPYLEPMTHPLLFCNLKKVSVNFSEIKVAVFYPFAERYTLTDGNQGVHQFDCGYDAKRLTIKVSNDADAQQITEALIALGMPIKGYVKTY